MEFLTNDKLTIVGAAGMIGSSMAADLCIWQTGRYRQRGDRNRPVNMMVKREYGFACINAGEAK
jgi:hypothetical protein